MRREMIITLKRGKEKPMKQRHHWIFSGAIHSMPEVDAGTILPVYSAAGEMLGSAYCNSRTSIVGRMLSFDASDPLEAVKNTIDRAIAIREQFFDLKTTNAYRVINSEGDGIPGLIVDRYDDVLVLQSATAGIDRLKPVIVEHLVSRLHPRSIYEKSTIPGRREEGLRDEEGLLYGEDMDEVEIVENNLKFFVSIKNGQKTGFFLDQREMRRWVGEMARGKRMLNCFGYTGGFSVYAIAGGAAAADTVDISDDAIALAKRNLVLNGFNAEKNQCIAADVFQFLREQTLEYDVIILDPPAFAKRKTDVIAACRGYKDINRLAIQKMPAGGILVTSSCSYHVDEKLFQQVIFQAALEAKRTVRIIGRHRQAPDHPINIYHPEGEYLKSLVLYID